MSDNRNLLIRKKIICLDQFAASKMDNKEGEWGYARELLYHAVKDNLAICPIPMEHYVETSKRSLEKAISTDSLLRSFSIGYGFKPWEYIVEKYNKRLKRMNNKIDCVALYWPEAPEDCGLP